MRRLVSPLDGIRSPFGPKVGGASPGPSGNGLVWDTGNYLIWGSGNYLTWGP
jgi:hypothetical protein